MLFLGGEILFLEGEILFLGKSLSPDISYFIVKEAFLPCETLWVTKGSSCDLPWVVEGS